MDTSRHDRNTKRSSANVDNADQEAAAFNGQTEEEYLASLEAGSTNWDTYWLGEND